MVKTFCDVCEICISENNKQLEDGAWLIMGGFEAIELNKHFCIKCGTRINNRIKSLIDEMRKQEDKNGKAD